MNFSFVLMLQSPGYIFGPLMLLGGLIAFAMCVRASMRADREHARRARFWSLGPVVLGVLGAIVGGVAWGLSDQIMADRGRAWSALGYTILFGVHVAAVPLIWSLLLLLMRPVTTA